MANMSTDAVDAFIRTKTTLLNPATPSSSVECPICFDNEDLHQITGIPGCNHAFGIGCLKAILSYHSRSEKRCPLCRTIWIHSSLLGPFNPARPTDRVLNPWTSSLGIVPLGVRSNAITIDDDEEGDDLDLTRSNTQLPSIRFRNHARRGSGEAAFDPMPWTSNEEDNSVTEESFEQFNRAIADIRRLAPRDRPGRRTGTADPYRGFGGIRARFNDHRIGMFGLRLPTVGQADLPGGVDGLAASDTRLQGRSNEDDLSDFTGPGRGYRQPRTDLLPLHGAEEGFLSLGMSSRSNRSNAENLESNGSNLNIQTNLPSDSEGERTSPSPPPGPLRFSSLNANPNSRDMPNINSPHTRILRQVQAVRKREIEVTERERKVLARENDVRTKEHAVQMKEQTLKTREQRLTRLLDVIKRQSDEQTQMAERQRRELGILRGSLGQD